MELSARGILHVPGAPPLPAWQGLHAPAGNSECLHSAEKLYAAPHSQFRSTIQNAAGGLQHDARIFGACIGGFLPPP